MATILLVDDDAPSRDLLKSLLRHGGHGFIEAPNGESALEAALANQPELIISDIVMPARDGFELAYEVAVEPRLSGSSFILYSATYLRAEAKALAAACGVHYFLTKPTDPMLLLYTVNEVLRLGRPERNAVDRDEFRALHTRLLADKLAVVTMRLGQEIADRKDAEKAQAAIVAELGQAQRASGPDPDVAARQMGLSAREREVLLHMATGMNNAEIASVLFVGEGTVKTHVKHIMTKLGVSDRIKAAVWALRNGFEPPDKSSGVS